MRSKKLIRFSFPLILLAGVYFLGPAPAKPAFDLSLPSMPTEPGALEDHIALLESKHVLKPDNEARIVWADSTRRKTPYAIVYLHGFSASQKEGDPVHRMLAKEFKSNLYLTRRSDHGIDTTESLLLFTAERIWNSAKEALAVGTAIGEKVILVSTSTGGTLALMLAAEYPNQVHALINLSPNIAINDPAAFLLNDPWGLHIARMVIGGKYMSTVNDPRRSPYWNDNYRLEAVVQLQELLELTMTRATFRRVRQPSLTLNYYKNDAEQDPQVKVSAMLEMHDQLGTPDSLKVIRAMPRAGAHVLGSDLTSGDIEGVYREMKKFVEEKIGIRSTRDALQRLAALNTRMPE